MALRRPAAQVILDLDAPTFRCTAAVRPGSFTATIIVTVRSAPLDFLRLPSPGGGGGRRSVHRLAQSRRLSGSLRRSPLLLAEDACPAAPRVVG
jgi:hypothetical protein